MAVYSGTPVVGSDYEVGDRNGKYRHVRRRLTITLATQGGATNLISAPSLGFATDGLSNAVCCLFTDGGAQKRQVNLFTDTTNLYVGDPTQATDANRGIPTDVTGTLIFIVEGRPA